MIKQYVWVRKDGFVSILEKPETILHEPTYDETADKIYELGSEVKITVTVSVKNKTTRREMFGTKD